jgi:hypothetical protein
VQYPLICTMYLTLTCNGRFAPTDSRICLSSFYNRDSGMDSTSLKHFQIGFPVLGIQLL